MKLKNGNQAPASRPMRHADRKNAGKSVGPSATVAYDDDDEYEGMDDPFGNFKRDPSSRASPSWDAFAGAVNDGPTMQGARKTYADAARKPASPSKRIPIWE